MPKMPVDEYVANLARLTSFCKLVQALPLDEMQSTNEHLQTIGPILDPTSYVRGGASNLNEQRRIINAARELQKVVLELVESATA